MRKEFDNLAEKIREKVKKHINNDNVTWTREALLRLIHIERRNVARQKSVKKAVTEDNQSPRTAAKAARE